VFVTGSGPQDRDESLMGHRPFLVMADALARRGIASVRFDDRGVGKSTGSFADATSDDFASDARAQLDWLAAVPEVDPGRIGFIGHSEGGLVGPLAAAAIERAGGSGARPAFLVMLAGPGVDGAAILKEQNTAIFRAAGTQGEVLDAIVRTHAALVDAAVAGASEDDLRALAEAAVDAQVRAGGAAAAMAEGEGRSQVIDGVVQQMRAPWMLRFMKLDPAPALRALRCPVLALFGERDLQVLPAQNEAPVAAALRDAGVKATVRTMPGLNHLFQPARRGTLDEYATIDVTCDPAVLVLVGDWILAQPPRSR
jgi:pimeloyl-ACP methyl ester carboxylesterase